MNGNDSFDKIFYSNHAVKQMFQREILTEEVEFVIKKGETIKNYPDDKPYPSKLLFANCKGRPLHVVCSFNLEENTIIVITAYEPTLDVWVNNFKEKKNK